MKKVVFLLSISLFLYASNIKWESNFLEAIKKAKKQNRSIMVFYESDDCSWCKKMLKTTFKDKNVINEVNRYFISVKVNKNLKNFPDYIKSKYTPTTFFINKNRENIIRPILGYWDKEAFLSFLDDVKRKLSK